MVVELIAVASTAIGAWLLSKKDKAAETGDNLSPKDDWQEPVVEETPDGTDAETTVMPEEPAPAPETPAPAPEPAKPADPRENEMYFGDKKGAYDPFYDYSNDRIYNSPYALQSIEGMASTRANAYRARIIRPAFGWAHVAAVNSKYCNYGMPMQTIKSRVSNKTLSFHPFVRGSRTDVTFALEIFNPFDFDSELEKLRISSVSAGGTECYICPPTLKDVSMEMLPSFFRPENKEIINKANTVFSFDNYQDLRVSSVAFQNYYSHYLFRFFSEDAIEKYTYGNMPMTFEPSDFEIILPADAGSLYSRMQQYTDNQFPAYSYKGKGYGKWQDVTTNYKPLDIWNDLLKRQNLSNPLDPTADFATKAKNEIAGVNGGIINPWNYVSKTKMIPARGSIIMILSLPLTGKPTATYWGHSRISEGNNPSNSLKSQMQWCEWRLSSDKKPIYHIHSPLANADIGMLNTYHNKQGGFLFIDTKTVDLDERDFRMKIAFFSDRTQSTVQNDKAGLSQRAENCRWMDIGMYRGGRPNGSYEWEKTYWDDVIPAAGKSSWASCADNYNQSGLDFYEFKDYTADDYLHLNEI